jgi:hypothetical protein
MLSPMFSKMSFREKAAYIWDYFHWYILGGLAALCCFAVIVAQMLSTPKTTVCALVMVDAGISTVNDSDWFGKWLTGRGYDTEETDVTTDFTTSGQSGVLSATSLQLLDSKLLTDSVNIVCAPSAVMDQFSGNNAFSDLRDVLDAATLEKYAGDLYYLPDTDQNGDRVPVGVLLGQDTAFGQQQFYTEAPVAALVASTADNADAASMLRYMLDGTVEKATDGTE